MTAKRGLPAAVLGALMLLELAVINLACTADQDFVYVLGRRINVVCAARQRLGVPCPTCGLTRGIVLTVHGRIGEAWRLSPTGPLAVVGIFGMGIALLAFASFERRRPEAQTVRFKRWVTSGALAYGGAGTLIWVSWWIAAVSG